jgi:cyclic pyranopterin phosphate synthase
MRVVEAGVQLGITKVRVTGGEPLVRKGLCDLLDRLVRIKALKDVSLTTNAVLLETYVDQLKEIGINRINISLDSLDRNNYARITGRDYFNQVWKGILLAFERGFDPIKINVVAMRGINDHEFINFAKLSQEYPFHIRFIEYMPIGKAGFDSGQQILTPDTQKLIGQLGELIPVKNVENYGPAFRYRFKDAKGEIGFISPISRHFCGQCDRLRLTANGMIRSCLLSDRQIDLKTRLREGITNQEIGEIFQEALTNKGGSHALGSCEDYEITTNMSVIGG